MYSLIHFFSSILFFFYVGFASVCWMLIISFLALGKIIFKVISILVELGFTSIDRSIQKTGKLWIEFRYPYVIQPIDLHNTVQLYDYCKKNRIPYIREEKPLTLNPMDYEVLIRFQKREHAFINALQFGNLLEKEE